MPRFALPERIPPGARHVGRRVLRTENRSLLIGEGGFVDDLPTGPGTLHAAFLRSPHPHAEIVSIDGSEALRIPGVHAIVTGEDMARETDPMITGFRNPADYYGMAVGRVRYVGEPVAVVAAADRYLAEDALDAIEVEYRALPAVVDPIEATTADAPLLHPGAGSNCVSTRHFVHGAPDEAFAEADHAAELTVVYPRSSITPMETYAVVARAVAETGGFDVLSNFQGPFSLQPVMARALRVRSNRLRLRSPKHSGGSFGSKMAVFPCIVVLCVLARRARRPVKWIEDRLEHLSAASSSANRVTRIEAAHTGEGRVTALRLTHWDDNGAYLRAPMPAPLYRMHGLSTNGYDVRHLEVTNHVVLTNKCPSGAVRGFGGPQLYFAVERMMQTIAATLGMDPLDVIRKNLIGADRFPYRTVAGALLDSGDYHRTIDEALAAGDLDGLKRRREEARGAGRLYGIGYAACVEPSQSNMGYVSLIKTGRERERDGPRGGAVASVTVSVDAMGGVAVVGDSVPQGQGHQTVLAQVVADRLGLDPDDVAVSLDTDTAKDGWSIAAGNYSSRFSPACANAALLAADRVRDKMARIAASLLNVPAGDLRFENGRIVASGNPDNAAPFHRIGGLAHWSPASLPEGMDPGLREAATWSAPELGPTSADDEINASLAYGFGFDFCGVEVDPKTGVVRIDKYATAHDCGAILNPGLAEGQIRGSWASAIGSAFHEEFRYGDDGSFLSGTFAEYLVPTACEIPELVLVHPTPTPSPWTRLGAKGIAECNQYTTPVCIANAVADALGVEDVRLPLAPSRVLDWIDGAEPPPPGGVAPAWRDGAPPAAEDGARFTGKEGVSSAGGGGAAFAGKEGAPSAGEDGAAFAGKGGVAPAGGGGAAFAGKEGAPSAGDDGAAFAGKGGVPSAGGGGAAFAGKEGAPSTAEDGAAFAGKGGVAPAGGGGAAFAGKEGVSSTGDDGAAFAGKGGVASAGGGGAAFAGKDGAPFAGKSGGTPGIEGEGQVEVDAMPEAIWDVLLDPERLATIVPGCERLEVIGEHRFRGDVMLGAGPVKGLFDVRIDLTDLDRPNRMHLAGSATGALGSSRGSGRLHLEPMGDSATLIRYRYAIRLSGKVAAVGGRLVRGAARQLIGRFMHALARQASGSGVADDAAPDHVRRPGAKRRCGSGLADDAAPAPGNGVSPRDPGVPPPVVIPAISAPSFPRKRESMRPGNGVSPRDAGMPPAAGDGGLADGVVPLRATGRAASPHRGDAGADHTAPARAGRNGFEAGLAQPLGTAPARAGRNTPGRNTLTRNTPARNTLWHRIVALLGGRR